MSKFEEYDLYSGKKDFLVSENIITFTDTDGRLLALKPDVTLSILKSSRSGIQGINRLQYSENVYRVPEGSKSFKELMQTGLECIGELGEEEICEVMLLAYESLKKISDSFALEISSIDLVDAIIKDAVLSDSAAKDIAYNLGRKNLSEIKKICERENCNGDAAKKIYALCELYGSSDNVIRKLEKLSLSGEAKAALDSLKSVCTKLSDMGAKNNLCIDFSLVANRKYYNGIAFKGFIEGIPGCILSGGQYDRLAENMRVRAKAIGFAVYLDELGRIDV